MDAVLNTKHLKKQKQKGKKKEDDSSEEFPNSSAVWNSGMTLIKDVLDQEKKLVKKYRQHDEKWRVFTLSNGEWKKHKQVLQNLPKKLKDARNAVESNLCDTITRFENKSSGFTANPFVQKNKMFYYLKGTRGYEPFCEFRLTEKNMNNDALDGFAAMMELEKILMEDAKTDGKFAKFKPKFLKFYNRYILTKALNCENGAIRAVVSKLEWKTKNETISSTPKPPRKSKAVKNSAIKSLKKDSKQKESDSKMKDTKTKKNKSGKMNKVVNPGAKKRPVGGIVDTEMD